MKKSFIQSRIGKVRIRFQISLLLLIVVMLGVSTIATISAVLSISRNVSTQNAQLLFAEAGDSIRLMLDSQLEKALQLAGLMSTLPEFRIEPEFSGIAHPGIPFIIRALRENDYLYSIYTGFENGAFLQLIKTSGNKLIIDTHGAAGDTAFLLRSINSASGTRTETWTWLDDSLSVIGGSTNKTPSYSPAVRPWFEMAAANPGTSVMTDAYIYDSLKQPGITAAAAFNDRCVAGIDITLADLKSFIDDMNISPNTGILLLDENKRILSANPTMADWMEAPEMRTFLLSETRDANEIRKSHLRWSAPWKVPGGQQYDLIIAAPVSDFLKHQEIIQNRIIIITAVIFAMVFPFIILASVYLSRFLEHLADDAERIQHLIFSGEIAEHSPIIEFEELAEAFRIMKKAISVKTRALQTALRKLERIIELGIAMSAEDDSNKLVEMILTGAKELSGADGGSVYLKGEDEALEFKIVLNDSLGFAQGGTSGNPVTMPPVRLYDDNEEPNYHNVVSCAYHKRETIVIGDAYENPSFDFSGTKRFDELNNYRSKSFLTVPLKLLGSDIIGALQLINCVDGDSGEVIPFGRDIQSFIEALSGLAAAILYNRSLLDSQDALFESLIQLTAGAIDTKSPYTGGHCERVPVLSQLLASAAEAETEGPLAEFRFRGTVERKAYQIGSWLHDAGKVTTPEFVVDKAVKLETIHNRIHEVRARFEILLRDARIETKDALINGAPPEEALKKLKKVEEALHEDFEFIARCNTGEEEYSEEYERRLLQISGKTWQSHFNHTAGLSREEAEKNDTPFRRGESLTEPLLADKPAHIIPDKLNISARYRERGFNLPSHKYLYNRGEVHNLRIKQGTLTEEERFKINEHIMQTIIMLEQLPFPSGMSKIPEYVGTHHETLSGTGYPRGLNAEQLSIPSRIMTIADIFEALTASDRPYKEAKKLSDAVGILHQYSLNGHIDPDLFRLFLTSGVYLEYAERFLPKEQIDRVDIDRYLG